MNIRSQLNNFPQEVKTKYFQISQELEQIIAKAQKEIKDTYEQCKNNKKFNRFDSVSKRKWYYERLKERIRHKVYVKYRLDLFGSLSRVADTILPTVVNKQVEQFVDIKNIGFGDKR